MSVKAEALTKEELDAAIACADKYRPGYGGSFVAVDEDYDRYDDDVREWLDGMVNPNDAFTCASDVCILLTKQPELIEFG